MADFREQRACIKFSFKLGKTATECYEMLKTAFVCVCVYVLTDFICAYLTAVLCEVRKYFYALSQLPHLIYMKLDTDPFSEMIDLF